MNCVNINCINKRWCLVRSMPEGRGGEEVVVVGAVTAIETARQMGDSVSSGGLANGKSQFNGMMGFEGRKCCGSNLRLSN